MKKPLYWRQQKQCYDNEKIPAFLSGFFYKRILYSCYTGFFRSLFHCRRNGLADTGIERVGKNIVRAELVVIDQRRDSKGSGYLHFFIDIARSAIESASENTGEREDVVDLIREVASACSHNSRACFLGKVGHDLGSGVCHCEDDRILRHRLHHILAYTACGRDAEEYVGALHRVSERTCLVVEIRDFRHLTLYGVESFVALADDALAVAEGDILDAHVEQVLYLPRLRRS